MCLREDAAGILGKVPLTLSSASSSTSCLPLSVKHVKRGNLACFDLDQRPYSEREVLGGYRERILEILRVNTTSSDSPRPGFSVGQEECANKRDASVVTWRRSAQALSRAITVSMLAVRFTIQSCSILALTP